ncbi:MAG: hypothetical protein ABI647_01210 [Gemmatimonadota bacterium]
MSHAPSIGVPELAGVATYDEAARIGYSVDENVRRLLRYQWTERQLMQGLIAHLPATPEWEVKGGLALVQWHCAEHVESLRQRIAEMRHPLPELDRAPDTALHQVLEEALRAEGTIELLTGCYDVILRALLEAYRTHLAATNPLGDHPTRRIIQIALVDHAANIRWAEQALAGLVGSAAGALARAGAWRGHVGRYLAAAGGIAGDQPEPNEPLPDPRANGPFRPSMEPARDRRFGGLYQFDFPPHVIYNDPKVPADERNLALLCKRALEMDVPEMMASVMVERADQPWEFHRDYSRQLWDEMRHAMMGTVALEARGVDWTRIPLNVGFSLRLNLYATPLERQILLFAIEQSLMPAETGKRFEYETAVAAGEALSEHFHDYDWADEVLHAQIGRRLLKREGITGQEAIDRAAAVQDKTWEALQPHRSEPERDWWNDFVQRVLGKPSALAPEDRAELKIIAE